MCRHPWETAGWGGDTGHGTEDALRWAYATGAKGFGPKITYPTTSIEGFVLPWI